MENNTQLMDPKDIAIARQFAGAGQRISIPFIPILKINNKDEEKEIDIEGQRKIVKIPAQKGFIIETKNGEDYKKEFYGENLEAVILKERYQIESKFGIDPRYKSYEFDNWSEPIKVFNFKTKKVIIEDQFSKLKKYFEIEELDSYGNKKKTFETFLVLYINVNGEIKRFKTKFVKDDYWFDYKKEFEEDTYTGYKTKFNLERITKGAIDFWAVRYEKGESVNLREQIELQKQILQFIDALKQTFNKDNDEDKWQQGPSQDNGDQTIKGEVIEEEISIDDIPF